MTLVVISWVHAEFLFFVQSYTKNSSRSDRDQGSIINLKQSLFYFEDRN
jgi:hypothetical protein